MKLGEHDHVDKLREISRILDKQNENPQTTDVVHADLMVKADTLILSWSMRNGQSRHHYEVVVCASTNVRNGTEFGAFWFLFCASAASSDLTDCPNRLFAVVMPHERVRRQSSFADTESRGLRSRAHGV